MKNLGFGNPKGGGKGKKKIHPSPSSPDDGLAVLTLLPQVILALTKTLTVEDKHVLAYLITRFLNDPSSSSLVVETSKYRCTSSTSTSIASSGGVPHQQPMFGCGCFECYTSFWIRWDASPDRELIHQIIEAFEEHLASKEKKGNAVSGNLTRRDRRKNKKKNKGRKSELEQQKASEVVAEKAEQTESSVDEAAKTMVETEVIVEQEDEIKEVEKEEVDEEEELEEIGDREKRRSWSDVMSIFNYRVWSLWSPSV
ncbi:hypothetical protein ZOSMA_69G00620 [Zostera marina]|uniref:Uncharacterized protein n=1 Tax=Zostera marina TaxID=29655 RepID=A0A0K9NRF4_ZOSMR|nr:hypothetical protein ZOSMA_69G00620 [Zostera marina]